MEGEEEGEEEEDAESDPKVRIFVCLVITQTVIMSDVTKVIVFEKINKKTKTTLASDCNVFIFFSTQIALKRKVNVSIN